MQEANVSVSSNRKKIFISQNTPESDKSPYFDLERKYNVELFFYPLIKLESLPPKEYRKQKIDITKFTAIIFLARNAVDFFFKTCIETKINIDQDLNYFCATEAIALYLQKFIQYRKRRVFFGADASNNSLLEVMYKHKKKEKFLYVCSENQQDTEIVAWLVNNECNYKLAFMYRSVSNDIKLVLKPKDFAIICFFTPSGIKSLLENFPDFKQEEIAIGAFGDNTKRAVVEYGFKLNIPAPVPEATSMVVALDKFLANQNNIIG